MENLKIKVNNESESKEVQELFFELGFEKGMVCGNYPNTIVAMVDSKIIDYPFSSSATELEHGEHKYYKELTLHQLRDLVVLKRNDVGDATNEDDIGQYFYYGFNSWYLFYQGKWRQDGIDIDNMPKPIEKKEMKEPKQAEFLVKTDDGYVLQVLDENSGGADVVRVPDGATAYVNVFELYRWEAVFYDFGKKQPLVFCNNEYWWTDFNANYPTLQSLIDDGDVVLWQRETLNDQVASAEEFKQPEDLPFLDNGVDIGIKNLPDFNQEFTTEKEIKTDFPLNKSELNHRVAKAFNAVRGTDLNEDDVNYLRELINLTVSHYGERK